MAKLELDSHDLNAMISLVVPVEHKLKAYESVRQLELAQESGVTEDITKREDDVKQLLEKNGIKLENS